VVTRSDTARLRAPSTGWCSPPSRGSDTTSPAFGGSTRSAHHRAVTYGVGPRCIRRQARGPRGAMPHPLSVTCRSTAPQVRSGSERAARPAAAGRPDCSSVPHTWSRRSASRSRTGRAGATSAPIASTTCRAAHARWGRRFVPLTCSSRRRSSESTMKTWTMSNVTVGPLREAMAILSGR
jgi:hypothetical protein